MDSKENQISELNSNLTLIALINSLKSQPKSRILLSNIVLISSYSLIALVSLVGNLLVCRIIITRKTSLTTTNVLITNLAVADLLMTTVNIPFNIARILLDNWPFGQILCVLVPLTQSTSVYCSTITMMFIALERYRTLIYNNGFTNIVKTLVIIWLTSVVLSLPHGMFNKVVVLDQWQNLIRCRFIYPEPSVTFKQRLTLFTFMTQYLIPILLTFSCYSRICFSLYNRKLVGSVSDRHRLDLNRHKRRRIKILVLVMLVFTVCWLPFNIYHLLIDFNVINFSSSLFFLSHWFAMSNVCYNPFIYCWMNEEFRKKFRTFLHWFPFVDDITDSLPEETLGDERAPNNNSIASNSI